MDKIIERSGCLTIFLVTMIIGNAIAALLCLAASENVSSQPDFLFPLLITLFILNTMFAIAIAMWLKWGIIAFVLSNLIILFLSVSHDTRALVTSVAILEIFMLFAALYLGGEQKTWLNFR